MLYLNWFVCLFIAFNEGAGGDGDWLFVYFKKYKSLILVGWGGGVKFVYVSFHLHFFSSAAILWYQQSYDQHDWRWDNVWGKLESCLLKSNIECRFSFMTVYFLLLFLDTLWQIFLYISIFFSQQLFKNFALVKWRSPNACLFVISNHYLIGWLIKWP